MKRSTITATTKVEVKPPQIRMLENMKTGPRKEVPRFPKAQRRHFLRTVPAKKVTFEGKTSFEKKPHAEAAVAALTRPRLIGPDFEGAVNVDGVMPPDTHGAVGLDEFVEVTEVHIDIFQKANPAQHTSIQLAAFFNYHPQGLTEPRVLYDPEWNRWVIAALSGPESSTGQFYHIAISTTPNATGPYFIYTVPVTFGSDHVWDFPLLGMDQDSIIITANAFAQGSCFIGADMFAVAKALLYNGYGFSVPVFTGLAGTLAPPIVLDQNARAFLIAAPFEFGTALKLYTLTNSSRPNAISLTGPVDVPVDRYAEPPFAQQPGTTIGLEALDGRFLGASTQNGDLLWQAHTIQLGSYPAPKFYQINTATNSVVNSGFFYASGTSFDFNASIVANASNDVFLTWSSTDPPANINAQVRFTGCDHNDGPPVPGAGMATFTSPSSFSTPPLGSSVVPWGYYSAVTIDPTNTRHAWLVNEDITAIGDWASRIDCIGF